MASKQINIGLPGQVVTADSLQAAFAKINSNFVDLDTFVLRRGPIAPASTVATIQAIPNPAAGDVVALTQADRAGEFVWQTGDFSFPISADPLGGCYIKATALSATAGAWVRVGSWASTGILIAWFGLTYVDDTATIQAALNLAANLATKIVVHGSQALTYSSTILIPAGVKLVGNGIGSFTQKAGANLYDQFVLSDRSEISNVVIDGNWAANPTTGPFAGIRIGNSNDCIVEGCTLKNFAGYGVVVNAGLRAKIKNNVINNFYNNGIVAYGVDADAYHEIEGNQIRGIGWGAIGIANVNFCTIKHNVVIGQLYGRPNDRQRVTTSGSVVTWVSGPNFSGLRKGNFFVANGGGEWRITSVDSATQITVDTSSNPLPTLSNALCITGSGDLIGFVQASFCNVSYNTIRDTTTYGSGYSLGQTAAGCSNNVFESNLFVACGKNAFCISGTKLGLGGRIENNSFKNNKIVLAGCGAGIGDVDKIAIYVQYEADNSIISTHISGNSVVSYEGDGQTSYWLGTSGNGAAGTITVNDNVADYGIANGSNIFQGIRAITLDAGWGTGASVSAITTDGKTVVFTITSGSTALAAGPGIAVSKIVESSGATPYPIAKNVSSPAALLPMWGEQLSSRGAWRTFVNGATPQANTGYTFIFKD